MSYSFRLPEEDPVCECKYDEAHDRMNREDCLFHSNLDDDAIAGSILDVERKPPVSAADAQVNTRTRKYK